MLRLILDEQGNFTADLFIKIDGRPSHAWTVDTTWLGEFLGEDHDLFPEKSAASMSGEELILNKKEYVRLLIRLWKQLLLSDEPICYLPCDLSDQCGWAFRVTKQKRLYHIVPVSTEDITDGTPIARFFRVQHDINWHQDSSPHHEWTLNPSALLTGLDWSLAKLDQPIILLRYE